MNYSDIQPIVNAFHRRLAATDLRFKRYLHNRINWQARLIGIKGARGVGKTTLMMQHIKEAFPQLDNVLYVSLDNLWFNTHNLEDLVEFLYTHGVTHLYLDEVHRYSSKDNTLIKASNKSHEWSQLLKNFYDNYPDLNIVYTGSAMLAIDNSKADLSRRQSLYTLNGLSFREYLEYEGIAEQPVHSALGQRGQHQSEEDRHILPTITLEELLADHTGYALEVSSRIKVLKHFDTYLQRGYYPYYKEAGEDYLMRVAEVAQLIIEGDMPSVEDITYATIQKIKKLLMVIAESVPLEPNINKLSAEMGTTRDQTLKMLYLLDRAALLGLLTDRTKDYKHLTGPKKIYLNNTNLMYALSGKISEGTLRETFFANQLGVAHILTMPKQGDFMVDNKYLFEVGGSRKTYSQIADMPNSYLAVDDMEVGSGCRIPLWLFGCLY